MGCIVLTYFRINERGNPVEFTYSSCDSAVVDGHTWYLKNGYPATSFYSDGVTTIKSFHNMVMNPSDGLFVDHISGVKTDCTRGNMRIVTRQQNNMNTGMFKHNTSGVKGVRWSKHHNRWMAAIGFKGTRYNLGCFITKDDAIKAREAAELKHFGKFRRNHEQQ